MTDTDGSENNAMFIVLYLEFIISHLNNRAGLKIYFTIIYKIFKNLYYKRVFLHIAHTGALRDLLFRKIAGARARAPARSATRNRCIRKQARARMWRACVDARDRALIDFFFTLAGTRRRISEFHRRPRLPDLRSIPKDEAAKPQIAQGPRHLIWTSWDVWVQRNNTLASVTSTDLHTPRIRCRCAGNRKPVVIFRC